MKRHIEHNDESLRAPGEDRNARRPSPVGDPRLHGARIYQETQAYDSSFVVQGDIYNSYNVPIPNKETWQERSMYQQEEKRREKCQLLIDSLKFLHMSARFLNVEKPLSETCQWVFSHEQFTRWTDDRILSEHHGFLWIKGKPGSGKSTIMKHLYDRTTKRLWLDQIVISYFFNARANADMEKSSLGLYRSLVYQLLQKLPALNDAFFDMFEQKEHRGVVEEWTAIELKAFLSSALSSVERPAVNILIDALDEGDEDDVRQMIEYLERLASTTSSTSFRLRICLSSRHYPHISVRNGISMILEDQNEHTKDIQTYLRNSLCAELLPLHQQMCEKSKGIFLWIVLVVRILNSEIDQGADIEKTEKLLDSLPADLNTLFEGIMSKNTKNIGDSIILFQWVLFSMRTLSLQDLYVAVYYSSASRTHDLRTPLEDYHLRRWLLHQSRGLLEIKGDESQHGLALVQFIHETVRTFLLSSDGISSLDPYLRVNIRGLSHDKLKETCLLCIKRNRSRGNQPAPPLTTSEKTRNSDSPHRLNQGSSKGASLIPRNESSFIEYASDYLLVHANFAQEYSVSQGNFLETFKASGELDDWCRTCRDEASDWAYSSISEDPLLYILADQNLPYLVECLLETRIGINAISTSRGLALHTACAKGYIAISRILLEHGANVNLAHNIRGTPFAYTVGYPWNSSRTETLILLIHHGASLPPDILVKGMTEAIVSESLPLLRLLLEKGGDPNAVDEEGKTMLHTAIIKKNTEALDLLLEQNVNVNATCGQHGSALQTASAQGNEAMVKKLIQAGANVNQRGGRYGSALGAAAQKFDYSMIKLLLGRGV